HAAAASERAVEEADGVGLQEGRMTIRRMTAGGALMLAMATAFSIPVARAADQTILGRTFVVKDPDPGVDPSARGIVALGKELLTDDSLVGDPLANGATIEIIANGMSPTQQTFTLPPGAYAAGGHGWKASGEPAIGFTWKDPEGQVGP